jgi:hypothetical protein
VEYSLGTRPVLRLSRSSSIESLLLLLLEPGEWTYSDGVRELAPGPAATGEVADDALARAS